MIIFRKAKDIRHHIAELKITGNTIGFVPTMGALHEGHISLIIESKTAGSVTVCSIFVNPVQFNNPNDFKKYPVTTEQDIYMLEKSGCDILFLPDMAEMYPNGTDESFEIDLGYLENILEGKYRPGHFKGVCRVVKRLLDITIPDIMYLGRKDYQQCMVIQKLIEQFKINTELKFCDTVREKDGLAMSSRNLRLNPDQRTKATQIYKTLTYLKENLNKTNHDILIARATGMLEEKGFKTDYIEICNAETLLPFSKGNNQNKYAVALIAAYLDDIRLIDNMPLD